LNKGIAVDHEFTEAYLARGQLLQQKQKWTQALHDFNMVQSLSPTLALGYLGAGDCYAALKDMAKAIDNYTEALELSDDLRTKVLLPRGRLYYANKEYDLALNDVTGYLDTVDACSVEALLIKGKAQRKKELINDAIINFEQVIKYDKEGSSALASIIKIAKIKLKQKDFYGAHHTLQRPSILKISAVDSKKLNNYFSLTEAVCNSEIMVGVVPDKEEGEGGGEDPDESVEERGIEQVHQGAVPHLPRVRVHDLTQLRGTGMAIL
jgi:tetratricopeptide (TPR) repeat protein